MKKCLAPCFGGCTDARYGEEAAAVEAFLATRGESRLRVLSAARDEASAELEFEQAAALHGQAKQVEAVSGLAAELVRPLAKLRACVALYLFAEGALHGPELFSTLGMRMQNEGSGSSSLYAQPVLLEPVPLELASAGRETLSLRLEETLQRLEARSGAATDGLRRVGDLALLTRWYYRPAQKRVGEIFFADEAGQWPRKAMLRGIGRVAAAGFAAGV